MAARPLLVAFSVAAAAGVVVGVATRGGDGGGPERPARVEAVLKAVDRDDPQALARALSDAGPASSWPAPWDAEVALGAAVATGDLEQVLRFGEGEPPGAARARALLYVRAKGREAGLSERAARRLAETYPTSWAVTTPQGAAAGGR
jgi:hypothetical protein